MSDATLDHEARAQRLVGMFLQRFARLETALDEGIGRLLSLSPPQASILSANMPFAKKVATFFSAEGLMAALPDDARAAALKACRKGILGLNEKYRIVFAHNAFSGTPEGVVFQRVVANGKLQIGDLLFDEAEILRACETAERLQVELHSLVEEMRPYEPSLDFSDPRNSMYLALIIDDL